jgi:hypothetical protein
MTLASTPAEFGAFLRAQIANWGKVILEQNIQPDDLAPRSAAADAHTRDVSASRQQRCVPAPKPAHSPGEPADSAAVILVLLDYARKSGTLRRA